eukprot:65204-Chlamydomonas_euryale.AAC.1
MRPWGDGTPPPPQPPPPPLPSTNGLGARGVGDGGCGRHTGGGRAGVPGASLHGSPRLPGSAVAAAAGAAAAAAAAGPAAASPSNCGGASSGRCCCCCWLLGLAALPAASTAPRTRLCRNGLYVDTLTRSAVWLPWHNSPPGCSPVGDSPLGELSCLASTAARGLPHPGDAAAGGAACSL